MKFILFVGSIFFAGLWTAHHFNMEAPVRKFDTIVSKVIEEIQKP